MGLAVFASVVVVLFGVGWLFLAGPAGLRAKYRSMAREGLSRAAESGVVTEEDVARLPPPVERYLRRVGVVGAPRVHSYHVRFTGRIRSSATSPWMPFVADQRSFVRPATRLFFMRARMMGLPVDALHAYLGEDASMQVKVLSMLSMVDVRGAALAEAETVTLFNDMCVMAPATLIDPSIGWTPLDERRVSATFTNAGHTIRATLVFDEAGDLVDFVSDDRGALQPDGVTFQKQRWSTPLARHRQFGKFRLPSFGEARYHPSTGEYAYGEFEMTAITYNETSLEGAE